MTDERSAAAAAGRGHVELGPVGVWTSMAQWPADPGAIGAAGAELEELGFGWPVRSRGGAASCHYSSGSRDRSDRGVGESSPDGGRRA
jgi:hypothetical protein